MSEYGVGGGAAPERWRRRYYFRLPHRARVIFFAGGRKRLSRGETRVSATKTPTEARQRQASAYV